MRWIRPARLKTDPDLAGLFPIGKGSLAAIIASMREREYDPAEPIVVWAGTRIVVDGHTRLAAATQVELEKVAIDERGFEDKRAALEYAIRRQRDRRNLTPKEVGAFTMRAMEALDRLKPRGAESLERGAGGQLLASIDANSGKSAAKTAAQIGVSQAQVERVRTVLASDNETVKEQLRNGELTIYAAVTEVKEAAQLRAEAEPPPISLPEEPGALAFRPLYSVAEWEALPVAERALICAIAPASEAAKNAGFNPQESDNIEWARWSWNPVTGCLHNCPYCYARTIAEHKFTQKFTPTFLPSRLGAPAQQKVPAKAATDLGWRNVFVCSMADLFGRWVPDDWISAVLAQVEANPQWNFLFLTKFPIRLAEFTFPPNAWVGTTVDCQARVAFAEQSFRKVEATVKWLSVEPMLQPLHFSDIGAFDWVVIGGASAEVNTPEWHPPRAWSEELRRTAEAAGCLVYEKTNLLQRIRDYPGRPSGELRQLPEALAYIPSIGA